MTTDKAIMRFSYFPLTFAVSALCVSLTACNQNNALQTEALIQTQVLTSGINLDNIDKTVRPQDNFYQYVNGKWLNNATIPGDKTAIGTFYELRDDADEQVRAIITELSAQDVLVEGSNEQKVADLYKSFLDTKTRNQLGITPINDILAEIQQINNKDALAQYFGKSQAQGMGSPLYIYIDVDAKKSDEYTAHVWQSGLGLPDKDYYFNEDQRFQKHRSAYIKHITNVLTFAQYPEPELSANKIMQVEAQLADFHWSRVETRNSEKRYNKYKITELKNLGSAFNWPVYLQAQNLKTLSHIIINQPSYIEGFDPVFAQTSLADWKSYLTFHAISHFASMLSEEIAQENFAFYGEELYGRKQQKPLWKKGGSIVNDNLGEVIGQIYVAKHFPLQAKAKMTTLVENLRSAYGRSINDLTWMSADTKKAAQVKLAAFTAKIGYPDQWQNYDNLVIKADDLVGNLLRSSLDAHQKSIAKLGQPIYKWEWAMTPQTVNAYYNPTVNEIVFPAAILQPPFFNLEADDAVNYGGIGAVIGHEMGHGFDDQGSKYDANGNLRNWWTEADLAIFQASAKNLVSQYNDYEVFDDLTVNGELTLGENIGDLSGVTIAYRAYKASLKGKEAPVIDGLTGDERFFMGFAQVWRSKKVEKTLRNQVATDPHSPSEFRALGSLSNMPEFYQTFNVTEGDDMYIAPEKRVKIW